MTNWTDEQMEVVNSRKCDLLVAAAAGSGKTAVLTEHILRLITEPGSTVNIDDLLVVTFTDKAAAEIKSRILLNLERKLAEMPENDHIAEQLTRIHTANISTIHSFCLSVIRNHFEETNIDPSFQTGGDAEIRVIRNDVMNNLIEDCCQGNTEEFLSEDEDYSQCAEALESGHKDDKIESCIERLYTYSQSYAKPKEWLLSCRSMYESKNTEQESSWEKSVASRLKLDIAGNAANLRRLALICRSGNGPQKYAERLLGDAVMLDPIADAGSLNEIAELVKSISWEKMPSVTSKEKAAGIDTTTADIVKKGRDKVKDAIKSLQNDYFYDTRDMIACDIERSGRIIRILIDLTLEFAKRFADEKQRRNLVDYNDMEHMALDILSSDSGGNAAAEYRDQFYEVMIDEYQDSNYLQEQLLCCVSGLVDGGRNRVMVGDVKQSIYGFRQSKPELFMEKYRSFPTVKGGAERRIDLHKNFRSRPQVIDSVNLIFKAIMRKEIGGIEYDEDQYLKEGAEFISPDTCVAEDYTTELMLLALDKDYKNEQGESAAETEARAIAARIRELVGVLMVRDSSSESGGLRPLRYRDIVILLRKTAGIAEKMADILTECGIPVFTESRSGYFEAEEVRTILDYLRILDNPRQDIAMAAVLHSSIGNFDSGELARIRTLFPDDPFSIAVLRLTGEGTEKGTIRSAADDELIRKLSDFMAMVSDHRRRILYTPLHRLIWEILCDTGYGVHIMAMPAGAKRKANIDLLVERAIQFEKTSYKGVFHFIKYLDQLKAQEMDMGEAGCEDENSDVVRIMTIHKSKGLEFPVVFAAGLGNKLKQRVSDRVVIHPQFGISMDSVDTEKRLRVPTVIKTAALRECELESLGEEIRILYVALTRAEEKLILCGIVENTEKAMAEWRSCLNSEKQMDYSIISRASTYLDLLVPPSLSGEGLVRIRELSCRDLLDDEDKHEFKQRLRREMLETLDKKCIYDETAEKLLNDEEGFIYPYRSAVSRAAKVSVSELKLIGMENSDAEAAATFEEETPIPLIPQFICRSEKKGGALRGTAVHRFLEQYDFAGGIDKATTDSIQKEIRRMTEYGGLTEEMASFVDASRMAAFLNSELSERMKSADRKGRLHREQPFVLGISGKELYPGDEESDTYLMQGIIDAYFEENGEIILVDYKTDHCTGAAELVNRYRTQLECYAEALERLVKRDVREKLLYSFALADTIRI